MASEEFQITIIEQGWLEGGSPNEDPCSHGNVQITIGGQLITSSENNYGISQSALALLRTLETDHSHKHPVAERLIFHGCSAILMMGCPIGIDWSVEHMDKQVLITNVIRNDTTSGDAVVFQGLSTRISEEKYQQQIVAFAEQARQLFRGVRKTFYDDFDRQRYEAFWAEYNRLLDHHNNSNQV